MIFIILPLAFFLVLLLKAEFAEDKKTILVYKPLETSLVIVIAIVGNLFSPSTAGRFILVGLILSLVGDVALVYEERRRHFIVGLSAFLLGHIAYSLSFTTITTEFRIAPDSIIAISLLTVAGLVMLLLMRKKLGGILLPAVIAYILIISFMVFRSFLVFRDPSPELGKTGLLFFCGALLFYASDVVLALNRFYRPLKYHRLSLILYYSGQTLIALGTLGSGNLLI